MIQFGDKDSEHNYNLQHDEFDQEKNEEIPKDIDPEQQSKRSWFSKASNGRFDKNKEQEVVIQSETQYLTKNEASVKQNSSRQESQSESSGQKQSCEGQDQPQSPVSSSNKAAPVKKETTDVVVVGLDQQILNLAPYYLNVVYYGAFSSNLAVLYYLIVSSNSLALIIGTIISLNYIFRAVFWYLLADEWNPELPLIQSEGDEIKNRSLKINLALLLNVDSLYWSYLIYWTEEKKGRDGVIEYLVALNRIIQVVTENLPILYISTYVLIQGGHMNLFLFPAVVFNVFHCVAIMYNINFFYGDFIDVLKWCTLRTCELWSKASIYCFALSLLSTHHHFYLLLLLVVTFLISLMLFIYLNDFTTESAMGSNFTFLIMVAKTIAIFSFKQNNLGYSDRYDSESQPDLYILKISKKTNTTVSYFINLLFYLQMVIICCLGGGLEILSNNSLKAGVVWLGFSCFVTMTLYYGFCLSYQAREDEKRGVVSDNEEKEE